MSKKKKIIISVTACVLILVTILTCIVAYNDNRADDDKVRKEYEQAQNANDHATTEPSEDTTSNEDIPPVIVPDDTGDSDVKDDIVLDVTDKDRDPNPGVVKATIEYGTKEGAKDAE